MGKIIVKERKGLPRTNKSVRLPDKVTWIKQPNIITLMSCDLNKMHLRVLVTVIDKIQDDINARISGQPLGQLSLFKDEDEDKLVKIVIPQKNFGVTPNHYDKLREAIKDLARIPVEINVTHPETGDATFNTSLLSAIIPKEGSERKNIIIRIEREVAKCLVSTEKGFHKYIKEITYSAKSKYTIRMYMLISSWKEKGGFSWEIDNLRTWLQLDPDEYQDIKDLEKRVIRPPYKELHENADCWFEYAFVYREGETEPYKINFKVIRSVDDEVRKAIENKKANMEHILKNNLNLTGKQTKEITDRLTDTNYLLAFDKLITLYQYITDNRNTIKSLGEYTYKSMMTYLDEQDGEVPFLSL